MLAIQAQWTSIDLTAARIGGGLFIALPWMVWHYARGGTIPWGKAMALSCFAGVLFSLVNIAGLQFAPVTHAGAISLGMTPVLVGLLSKPLLGTSISRDHWLALMLILIGIGTVWLGTSLTWRYALGDLCFLMGATLWALYAIFLKRWAIPASDAAFYTSLGSAPFFVWYLLFWDLPETTLTLLGTQLLYQGLIVGILAIYCYGKTVSILGPQLGSLFSALPPVIVPVAAAFLIDYHPHFYEYIGVFLVVTGMLLAFFKPLERMCVKPPRTN